MRDNVILRVAAKILFAPIIVFGLYVQFHGDYGPGGGFQAGVIIAAAFILHALVFGLEAGRRLFPLWLNIWLLAAGVLIYGAVGVASMGLNGLFLDYNVLAPSPASRQIAMVLPLQLLCLLHYCYDDDGDDNDDD